MAAQPGLNEVGLGCTYTEGMIDLEQGMRSGMLWFVCEITGMPTCDTARLRSASTDIENSQLRKAFTQLDYKLAG
jgi:hypothetical protein